MTNWPIISHQKSEKVYEFFVFSKKSEFNENVFLDKWNALLVNFAELLWSNVRNLLNKVLQKTFNPPEFPLHT